MNSPDTTYVDNQDDEALELAALSHISSARALDVETMRKWAAEVVRLRAQNARLREALGEIQERATARIRTADEAVKRDIYAADALFAIAMIARAAIIQEEV